MFICFVLAISVGCKKELITQQEQKQLDSTKVYKIPTTTEELLLVDNLNKITEIFKELYKEKSNLKVVNAAILSKAYSDQSVLLKDLIYPNGSWLSKVEKFNLLTVKWNISIENFAANFWKEVEKKHDPSFYIFLSNLNIANKNHNASGSIRSNALYDANGYPISIYFPYLEQFVVPGVTGEGYYEPITTIVTATADADEGWGSQPFFIDGVFQYYTQVLVNDDYAIANPTQIIGVNGIEPEMQSTSTPPPPSSAPGVNRVYIGDGLCKIQYDRLISFTGNGGGSEIKYCRLSGYLQPVNGQISSFQDIISVNFNRYEIREQHWALVSSTWDDDWVAADLEQVLAIYEEDNTNTKTFNGSIGTTLTVDTGSTISGNIGFTVSIQSQDEIIRQLKISRNSYFTGAFQDQGFGFSGNYLFLPLPITHGWPHYDAIPNAGANVGWTWPYSVY